MAILLLVSTGDSIRIGKIDNYIMIGIANNPLLNITQNECICQMVRLNGLISAMNYFQTNTTCQLYSSNITSVVIEFNLNSSFIFINQSFISITTIQPNSKFIVDNTFTLNLFKYLRNFISLFLNFERLRKMISENIHFSSFSLFRNLQDETLSKVFEPILNLLATRLIRVL